MTNWLENLAEKYTEVFTISNYEQIQKLANRKNRVRIEVNECGVEFTASSQTCSRGENEMYQQYYY